MQRPRVVDFAELRSDAVAGLSDRQCPAAGTTQRRR
jgi:hypothetical protein